MIKIGITGSAGFIGSHLYNTIGLTPDRFERVVFDRNCFEDPNILDSFVSSCDVIVHLAAMNRHEDPMVIYQTNLNLVSKLVESLKRVGRKVHLLFSSSTQEERANPYGNSKSEGRAQFSAWANETNNCFTGLIIPNVFGPFGQPFYNSVVATFCHQVLRKITPKIDVDGELKLIYVGELVEKIIECILQKINQHTFLVAHTATIKVSAILDLLTRFESDYQQNGILPSIQNRFEHQLFNTFRCFMDVKNHYPVKFKVNSDQRGDFVEVIKLNMGGQVSFSTTLAGITRGNHFHTRKIERFAVIKGKALIQLRRIGTDEVLDFYLSGEEPAYVDMPIWFTHNIKNIGEEEVYTIFWINEFYDSNDPDTYFVNV